MRNCGSLDAPGFAWEYLRRNSDFQQDRRKLERASRGGVLNQTEVDAFARRWGVRFRKRRRNERPDIGAMGRPRPTKRECLMMRPTVEWLVRCLATPVCPTADGKAMTCAIARSAWCASGSA
jgi:hypothetical protein